MVQEASERAIQLGYHIDFINIGFTAAEQRAAGRILRARGIRGALLHSNPVLPENITTDFDKIAVVLLFNEQESPRFHAVGHNHFQGMEMAMRQIESRGYTRPLAVFSEPNVSNRHWQGALDIFCQHHSHIHVSIIDTSAFWNSPVTTLKQTHADVIIASWDRFDLRQMLSSAGLRIPRDIGYCFLDTDEELATGSGICQRPSVVVGVGLDLLDRQLQCSEFGIHPYPMQVMLDGYWVEGTSLKSASAAAPVSAGKPSGRKELAGKLAAL